MPAARIRDDRNILIGGGILVLAIMTVAVLVSPATEQRPVHPSSYLAEPGGAKAAYLLLLDLGYQVERWELPATALPSNGQGITLILADPYVTPTEPDRQALRNFLVSGGSVLATGRTAGALIPAGIGLRERRCDASVPRYSAAFPSPLTRRAPEITITPQICWSSSDAMPFGLYVNNGIAAVVTYRVGRGRVIWWAGSEPLSNASIQKPGNLTVLLNAAGAPGAGRLLWDEYYHGYQGSMTSYLERTPVAWALAQALLLFLAVCATFARRRGPLRPVQHESRLSPLEFTQTLGDLYHQAHASAAALNVFYQRVRFQLARKAGTPPSLTGEALCAAVERRLGRTNPDMRSAMRLCESAVQQSEIRDPEALLLIQQLYDSVDKCLRTEKPRDHKS